MKTSQKLTATGALALLLAAPSWPARAAIEHDRDTQHGDVGSSLGFDITVAEGQHRYLLLAVTVQDASARVRRAGYAGQELDLITAIDAPLGGCRQEWWGLINPPTGTRRFELALTARSEHVGATLISYRGVDQLSPIGATATAAGTTAPAMVSLASAPGEIVIDGVCAVAPGSVLAMAGTGQVARWHWSLRDLSSAGSQENGTATATASWTASASNSMDWAATFLSLKPSDGRDPPPDRLQIATAGCSFVMAPARKIPTGFLGLMVLAAFAALARAGFGKFMPQGEGAAGTSRRD